MNHSQPVQNTIMETNSVTTPQNGNRSPRTRSPLSNRANIDIDIDTTAKATNWEHKDSSEGPPSTHESICDAAWISTSDLAKSPYQTPGRPVTPLRSIDIDLESESPLSRLETPFLYGYGTELAPILEQRSIATLRTKGSLSTSDLSSLLHDAPGASSSSKSRSHSKSDNTANSHSHSRSLHRQPSFSPQHAGAETTTTTTTTGPSESRSSPQLKRLAYSRPTVHIVDVHAYPRKPIYPAPQRPRTPPSLRRISLARPQSEGDAYVSAGTAATWRGVAYEEPGFRAPRSGHGNLSTHPFMSQSTTAIAGGVNTASASASAPARGRRNGNGNGNEQHHHHHNHHHHLYLPTPTTTTMITSRGARRGGAHRTSRSQRDTSTGSPDIAGYLAPPETRGGTCKKCRHPRGERWSLGSTLVGFGPGMRRGSDWCSRCACRKIVRAWCCGNSVPE
ncbi:hypothetical protein F4859DRAFT_379610 [Xylaria cf. heliscus]|nr:hypothetical protein F4859DRAFT_379610 [Xylaria cf. heliscus]